MDVWTLQEEGKAKSVGSQNATEKIIGEKVASKAPVVEKRENIKSPILKNRTLEIAWHIPWYGFKTQSRLAQDSGVSPTAISRLVRGISQPSLPIALRVTRALSQRLGSHLDLTEVFSLDGSFPTHSVCHLTGCRRCQFSPPSLEPRDSALKIQDVPSTPIDSTPKGGR